MNAVRDYATAIVRRARDHMEPHDFEPDWADQPRRHKVYPGAPRFPLPPAGRGEGPPLEAGLTTERPGAFAPWRLDALGDLLHESIGLTGRRLAVTGNSERSRVPAYYNAVWSRGVANGGGLYPTETYLVTGGGLGPGPGVYHYSPPHHALQRLLAGDVLAQVEGALGDAAPANCEDFLLVSVKIWKNSFKYNTFSYHVVTTDVGTVLGAWQTWSRAHGRALRPVLAFDALPLDRLLGLDTDGESVLAVVPLPRADGVAAPAAGAGVIPGGAQVTRVESERSRRVLTFGRVEKVHRMITETRGAVPKAEELAAAAPEIPAHPESELLRLPPPAPLHTGLRTALRRRRSSFGRFSGHRPLTSEQLSTVLAKTAAGRLGGATLDPDRDPPLTRLVAFVNHVEQVPSGVYDFDPAANTLGNALAEAPGQLLQHSYFLANYNLEQAGAVLAVVARPETAVDTIGPLGYRLVNAEVGAVVQAGYTVCSALGIGCGAAFGFDAVSHSEWLGLEGTGQWPLVILMIGNERASATDYDYRIA